MQSKAAGADHQQAARAAPERMDVPFDLKRVDTERRRDGGEIGVFEGLASTFGNQDLVGDVVEAGAFADAINDPRQVKMLWQHDSTEPIGVWRRLQETPDGLAVEGELIFDVQRGREAHALMKAGAVDALSIGFRVPEGGADIDPETGTRKVHRVQLWEISVVTFPANPKARIDRVKSLIKAGTIPTERDFERLLRDAGLSRSQAKAFVACGFSGLRQRDAGDGPHLLIAALNRAARVLTHH